MISVIIPLYNKERYIKQTIECVLNQTFRDFELIIVNDGSKDNGPAIVKQFTDSRLRLLNKTNGGVSSARNVGIKNAVFNYIAFLDADDEWQPGHLEVIHQLIKKYGHIAEVFVANFARKYTDGKIVPNRISDEMTTGIVDNYFKLILKKAIIHTSCVCISREVLLKLKGFDERMARGEDLDLWSRLAKKCLIAYSNDVTSIYLQEAVNNSNKKMDIKKSIVYYLDFKKYNDRAEKKFFKQLLYKKYAALLFCDFDFKNFYKLFSKQGFIL